MRNSIVQPTSIKQVQEVQVVPGKSFYHLLKGIAHEYGNYVDGEYSVNLTDLTISDKRLLLSHIVESEDYEWACQSYVSTECLFKENLTYIQNKMSDIEDEVYEEIMEEMGKVKCHHKDNNEVFWR